LPNPTQTRTPKTGGLHGTLTIDAQLADLTARERLAERKRDTRRKVIMGALAGYHMRKNPKSDFAKKLAALIDEYVIGDKERALFDLEPLPKPEQDLRKKEHRDVRKEIENVDLESNQKT